MSSYQQGPLFPERNPANAAAGGAGRDDGMDRVDENMEPDWRAAAEAALRYCCEHRQLLTADNPWFILEDWEAPMPHEPRALGPLMKSAVGWGWLTPTGRFVLSIRPSRHRAPIAEYASRLYTNGQTS